MIGQLVARRKDVRSMLKQEKDAGRRAQLDIRQKAPKANDETYMTEVNKLHAKSESP